MKNKYYCKCRHHSNDHSYYTDTKILNLDCDLCDCEDFESGEDENSLQSDKKII